MSPTVQPLRRCFFRVIEFASLTAQSGGDCLGFCGTFSVLDDKFHCRANKTSPRTFCGVLEGINTLF
ncbi:hypothetical protein [Providencia rustigianii]|uniref:hypothetical protein n=1 Tax=Providencia rustigianii TaxID=158850 RepID=UPI0011C01AF8|nr:hypothetical protein [Providencia rustigianii]